MVAIWLVCLKIIHFERKSIHTSLFHQNAGVLRKRRKISPLESVGGKISDWTLCFMKSFPYVEPGMGNAQKKEGAEIHGVLHKLSIEGRSKIEQTLEFDLPSRLKLFGRLNTSIPPPLIPFIYILRL